MIVEMRHRAIKIVGKKRTSRAALIPVRSEHEMIDQQLAAPVEQIGKRFPSRRRIERIILVNLHPWQGLAAHD